MADKTQHSQKPQILISGGDQTRDKKRLKMFFVCVCQSVLYACCLLQIVVTANQWLAGICLYGFVWVCELLGLAAQNHIKV